LIRPARPEDFDAWLPLWHGYNDFYGREGETALPDAITRVTWQRFFDPLEPMYALVAERDGAMVGLVHYLYHRSTIMITPDCYLRDLYTVPESRGQGVGRALIEGVYAAARAAGVDRVYWQTHTTNTAGRTLYDKVADNGGFIVYRKML
jgi:GNAT superfamily N-acetyltransferase